MEASNSGKPSLRICVQVRGLTDLLLTEEVEISTMSQLAQRVVGADYVIIS